MSVAKTNQKLMETLRHSFDYSAVEAAYVEQAITPIQKKSLLKWFDGVLDMRNNPLYHVQDETGQSIGYIETEGGGTSWVAYMHGKPLLSERFDTYEAAERFVQGK